MTFIEYSSAEYDDVSACKMVVAVYGFVAFLAIKRGQMRGRTLWLQRCVFGTKMRML